MFTAQMLLENAMTSHRRLGELIELLGSLVEIENETGLTPTVDVIRASLGNRGSLDDPASWFVPHVVTTLPAEPVVEHWPQEPVGVSHPSAEPDIIEVCQVVELSSDHDMQEIRVDDVPDRSQPPRHIQPVSDATIPRQRDDDLSWSDAEIAKLRELKGMGMSYKRIGNILQRPDWKCKNKWSYLNQKSRDTAIREASTL